MTRLTAITGGVTAPKGVRAAGVACGIKAAGLDLALVATDQPAAAAGVFTTNRAQAAPVLVSREHLGKTGGSASAVVVNSGCANACTGLAGLQTARDCAAAAAAILGCRTEQVLVASTGVIGVALDGTKIRTGLHMAGAALSVAGHAEAARAILTTDPFPKEQAVEIATGAGPFVVGGMAKGSGMIEPRMATMLAVLATDAQVEPALLDRALREAVATTFNAITVDGECSTNDCVILLATGRSGVRVEASSLATFVEALEAVCRPLALDIVRGGEGATRLVAVRVTGAPSDRAAEQVARTIANSPLCKTAVHGADPNWGRLIAAAGRSGVAFDPGRATVSIGPVVLFGDGRPHDERAAEAARHLGGREVDLYLDLGTGGPGVSTVWTCDLSAEYVRINAEYRT